MVFVSHDSWVRGVIIHPSGKYIMSCSDDKTIRVFDIKENRCLRTITDAHNHFVTCMAFSAKNATLITGSVDKNIGVWSCT
jgi:platelet-activating factor acetylhydrolase IB subunit alpha